MANALYDKGREGFLDGSIDWDTDNIRGILIDAADYTVNLATHDFLDDVAAGARVSVSGNMTGKTVTAGVADGDNLPFTAVTGDSVEALILYKHTGSDATSRLIAYLDTGVGIPFTPSGADFLVVWDDGANKIFKL
jgi:hypothetical protein